MPRFPLCNSHLPSIGAAARKRMVSTESMSRTSLPSILPHTLHRMKSLDGQPTAIASGTSSPPLFRTGRGHNSGIPKNVLPAIESPINSYRNNKKGPGALFRGSYNTGMCCPHGIRGMHRLQDILRTMMSGERYSGTQRPGKLSPRRQVRLAY
jgi:hypothetical protein